MENQTALTIEYVNVKDLIPYDKNPRNNTPAVEECAESIKSFGFGQPIIIDENNVIVCGHTRRNAAIKLGMAEVPCIRRTDLTPEQIRAYRVVDNKISELSEWNEDLLKEEVLALPEFNFGSFGFDMDDFTSDMADADTSEDEFDVDAEPEEINVKSGEVWQLGAHRLMIGDSTKPEDVKKLMGGELADMVVTDPPYNVAYEGKDGMTIENDSMEDVKFREFLRAAFGCAEKVMKPGAAFYIFHADSEGYNFRGACHDVGLRVRQCLVWKKNALVLGRQDYQWIHEPCLYGWKEGAGHSFYGDRKQTTVLEYDKPRRSDLHPCLDPKTLVMTIGGYRSVSEVKNGDLVLSEDGRFHLVECVSRHPYEGMIYDIHVLGNGINDRATNNHPYLIAQKTKHGWDVDWKRADELSVGMYTMTPVVEDGDKEPVSELDAWAYGLWLAQGSLLSGGSGKHKYPVFTIDGRKTWQIKRIAKWAGQKKCTTHKNSGNGMSVFVFDHDKAEECVRMCGKYASGKKIHADVFGWNMKLREAFFRGYMDGDGCAIRTRRHLHAKTVSRDLASQIRFLSESLGYKTAFYPREAPQGTGIDDRKFKKTLPYYSLDFHPDTVKQTERQRITYNGHEYWIRKIDRIRKEPYRADVVNLTVSGSHTFQTACGMTHNTMKPIALFCYQIGNSSKKGDRVLDLFCGSGTTLICCERMGRIGYGMEFDPKYAQRIINRWEEETGQKAVKIEDSDAANAPANTDAETTDEPTEHPSKKAKKRAKK